MDNLKTSETCDKCGKSIEILIADFERAMKDDLPVLCPDCHDVFLKEQMESMPSRIFKYKIFQVDAIIFDDLGAKGWELVSVSDGKAYFKKEYYQEDL